MSRSDCFVFLGLLISSCSGDSSTTHSSALIAPEVAPSEFVTPTLPQPEMHRFIDPKLGFDALVPADWRRVELDEAHELSYSVSFESPPSNESDRFADYLLVEVVPGLAEPSFAHQPNERAVMQVDGSEVFRERFVLDNYPVKGDHIDLVAWQISLSRPGYTVSLFAVGESREDARLERILIEFAHSFSLKRAPFQLS